MLATVSEAPLSGHWPRLQHPEEWAHWPRSSEARAISLTRQHPLYLQDNCADFAFMDGALNTPNNNRTGRIATLINLTAFQ